MGVLERTPFFCEACSRGFLSADALHAHTVAKHGGRNVRSIDDPACMECGATATLVGGERLYPHRPDLYEKRFWLCECGAYCGCHGLTSRPLGQPCGAETRRARTRAHDALDRLWQSGRMTRTDTYAWLAVEMGMTRAQCHIGLMTAAQASLVCALSHARWNEEMAAMPPALRHGNGGFGR